MVQMKRFKWVEHPSDIGFRAYGRSLAEAFENAALALFEIMTDTTKVEPKREIEMVLKAEDEEALLYDWIDRLIYFQDSRGLLFSKFKVEIAAREGEVELRGKAWGEKFNPQKHQERTHVKAMTYHLLKIEKKPKECWVQAVVDI